MPVVSGVGTAATSVGAPSLQVTVPAPAGGGLLYVVVLADAVPTVIASQGGIYQSRGTFSGPGGQQIWLFWASAPPQAPGGQVMVTVNVAAPPTSWGVLAVSIGSAPSSAPFDPGGGPIPSAGGGSTALGPYNTTVGGDLTIALVIGPTSAPVPPGLWTPLTGMVVSGTISCFPFVSSPAAVGSGLFTASLPSVQSWTLITDAILALPPMAMQPTPMQSCFSGPAASTVFPPAIAAAPAPATLAKPRAVYVRCSETYVDASGSPVSGP